MNNETSVYFSACCYAVEVLGDTAPKYFSRIQQLSQTNTLEELKAIIDSWAHGLKPTTRAIASGLWKPGSAWGTSVRVAHDRGVFWKLKCPCGAFFTVSTNDSTPETLRKCEVCRIEELSKVDVEKLQTTAGLVLLWYEGDETHQGYDKLVWREVHGACRRRKITDPNVSQELHAMCWAKISEKASSYTDRGFKVSSWLVTVAHNALIDHFAKDWHRNELAPMQPYKDNAMSMGIPNPNPATREERLPAKRTNPRGASPSDDARNAKSTAWDRAQGWNTSSRAGA